MGKYLILSLKKYIADRIIEAQTKHFIVAIKSNIRKCGIVNRMGGGQLTIFCLYTFFSYKQLLYKHAQAEIINILSTL